MTRARLENVSTKFTVSNGRMRVFEFNRNVGGCADIARPSERTCVSFVWNRIAQWSPRNPGWKAPKGAGKEKHKGKQ